MQRFTLIAYKPDSSDSCRGCHMASYYPDCKITINLTREELIEKWAGLQATELQCNETGYSVTVLVTIKNVICAFADEIGQDGYTKVDTPDLDIYETEEYCALDAEFGKMRGEVEARAKQIEADRKTKKAADAYAKSVKESQLQRQREIDQLAALKAKYEKSE